MHKIITVADFHYHLMRVCSLYLFRLYLNIYAIVGKKTNRKYPKKSRNKNAQFDHCETCMMSDLPNVATEKLDDNTIYDLSIVSSIQ